MKKMEEAGVLEDINTPEEIAKYREWQKKEKIKAELKDENAKLRARLAALEEGVLE